MKHQKALLMLLSLTLLGCTACGNSQDSGQEVLTEDALVAAATSVDQEKIQNTLATATFSQKENEMYQVGDTVTHRSISYQSGEQMAKAVETVMEYTVQKVEIYDHYTDTGIPKSEFEFGLSDQKMIMLEIKVKKVSGPQWQDEDSRDNISCLQMYNKNMLEEEAKGGSVCMPESCYFSGHSEVDEYGKGYNRYWLDPGEEAVFQVGWCVHDPWTGKEKNPVYLNDTEGLALHIGNDSHSGEFIDLTTE